MQKKEKFKISFITLLDVNDEELLYKPHVLWKGVSTFTKAKNKMYKYADKFENSLKDFQVDMRQYASVGSCEVSYQILLNDDSFLIYEIRLELDEEE